MSDCHFEKSAKDWLVSIKERTSCSWCRNPWKPVYRKSGMCRSCYEIRRELRSLHKRVKETEAKYGKDWLKLGLRSLRFHQLEVGYSVAIEMAESAQILGRSYHGLLDEASTLECEQEFRSLSKRFLKKDLYTHNAFMFEHFSPVHRRFLMYLISAMMQEYYSRNRRKMAHARVIMGDGIKEVLRGRAWGTYRVEDDVKPKVKGPAPKHREL